MEHTPTPYTPTPWRIDRVLTCNAAPIITAGTCWRNQPRIVAKAMYHSGSEDPEVQANAKFIVRACNSHEELLRVCGELRREIETAWACGDLIKIPHESARMWQLAKWSDRLQAAIEKAERR